MLAKVCFLSFQLVQLTLKKGAYTCLYKKVLIFAYTNWESGWGVLTPIVNWGSIYAYPELIQI